MENGRRVNKQGLLFVAVFFLHTWTPSQVGLLNAVIQLWEDPETRVEIDDVILAFLESEQ